MSTFFFAGKVIKAILKPLQWILEEVFKAIVEPVLNIIINVISSLFQKIFENIIIPIVEYLANNLAMIIEKLIVPLAKILMLLVQPLMSIGMMFIFKIVSLLVGQFLSGILFMAVLPVDFLEKNSFLVTIADGMQVLAIALLGLFAAYYGVKSMFLYLGFKSEEPWKIMVRVGAAAILIYGSIDICSYFFKFYYVLQDTIFLAFGMGQDAKFDPDIFGETLSENMFNTLDPASQLFDCVVFITLTWKLIILAIKFVERQVILMVYTIFAPLTMACSVAEPIRDFFSMWVKSFVGNFLIQGVQIAGVCLVFAITNSGEYKTSAFLGSNMMQNLMILGCITVISKADVLVQSITGQANAPDFGAQGFQSLQSMATSLATKALPQVKAVEATMKAVGSAFKK